MQPDVQPAVKYFMRQKSVIKRRAAGMTEVKGLQPLGVRDCCCLPAIKNPGTLLRDDLGQRLPQVLAKQRPRIPSGWGAGQHLHA